MSSIAELMQLCRLCLVKDQVDVPIFEDSGDLHERCLKIAACLPVKVKKDDKLPKKICSGCSYKLDLLYQFYNTSASADKQLKTWLSQLEGGKTIEGEVSSKESLTKSEPSESGDAHSLSADAESYIMQQQKLPYQNVAFPFQEDAFVEPQPSSSGLAEETETRTPSKRKRKTIQTLPVPDSDEEDDPHSKIAKLENDSDSDNDNDNDNFIPDDTSDSEQPGPSGLGKVSGDTPVKIENSLSEEEMEPYAHLPTLDDDFQLELNKKYEIKNKINTNFEVDKTQINGKIISLNLNNGDLENSADIKMDEDATSTIKDDISKNTNEQNSDSTESSTDDNVSTSTSSTANVVKKSLKMIIKINPNKTKSPKKSRRKVTEEVKFEDEPIQCTECDETFKNNLEFGLHSKDHSKNNKYGCHMCSYTSASKYHFEMHIKAHEGKTKYKCDICNKAFTVSTHAIEHKYFHTGEKPFQCEICGKHFMFSWFLTSHRRTQHFEIMTGMPLVKYDCLKCNKHYTSSTGLKRHNLSKHNEEGIDPSVLCDRCGKQLSSKEKLKFHRRIHTGYKPYTCVFCAKSFSRKEQLKEHERVHTGEKPFICKFCGKGFTQRSPLRIHERTHTGERPYICRLCNKGYISKGVMDTHMKNCNGISVGQH